MIRIFIILLLLLLQAGFLNGQKVRLEQITNESGRSLGFVSGMVQDSTGFMWLATRNGLYRYDGYSYKLFRHNRKDSTSLPYNDLTYLYLDRDKYLWMRHYNRIFPFKNEQVVDTFDYITNNFFDVNSEILQDKFHNYWIAPVKNKLIRYNPQKSIADTFSMAVELEHPQVMHWLRENQPDSMVIDQQTLNIEDTQQYLVVSCGEGSGGNIYDYGTIRHQGKIIYDARETFNPVKPKGLFRISSEILTLKPGQYEITFHADGSNSFEKSLNPLFEYGIALYPVKTDSEIAKLVQLSFFPERSIHAKRIKDIAINNHGLFTLLTENGIHTYDTDTWHSIEVNFAAYTGNAVDKDSYNMPLFQSNRGDYWIGTHKGLIKVNEHETIEHVLFNTRVKLYNIKEEHNGDIWLTSSNGLYHYDPQTGKLQHYEQNNKNRLYSNQVLNVLEDYSHNLWIATTEGLNRLRPSKFQFADLGMDNYSPFPILQVSKDRYITAGQKNELYYFSTGKVKQKTFELPVEIFPVDDYTGEATFDITDIMIAGKRLYITFSNRVAAFSYPTLEFLKYTQIPDIEVDGQQIDNHALFMLHHGNRLWVAAVDGLYAYDTDIKTLENKLAFDITFNSVLDIDNQFIKDITPWKNSYFIRTGRHLWKFKPSEPAMNKVFEFPKGILQTSLADGDCYIDSARQALWFSVVPDIYKLSLDNNRIDTFRIKLNNVDLGNCIIKKHDSLVWIATNNGIIRFQPASNDFVRYTSSDGLADNNVNGVYPDIHNNIWITSLKGLTKMNIENEQTETFFRRNDFDVLHFLKQHYRHPEYEHQLLLPTTSGYMRFNPDSLNPFKPPLVISNIYLFGKLAVFDSLAHQKRHIELPYNKNFITFELAALDYTEPSNNIFRYKLENFNDQWIYTDANNRKAPYTGLPPGDYTFIAQGTNNDGVWSEPLKLQLIIHPPWYRTLTAYISYIVLTILGIILFIRYRERKLKHEKKILEEKVRERTAEIRRQRDEIAQQKKDITDSIHYASRIQNALLPSHEFARSVLNSYFILFKPRDIVSGDYYWLTQIDNKTIVVAADCTGHGVPGAFMSMLGVAFLNEIVVRDKTISTNEILDKLREYVIKSLKQTGKEGGSKDGMDIALTIINHDTLEAQFSGAYNSLYILRNGEIETIKADRMPIGYHIKIGTPFSKNEIKLQPGDRLYMFSDGYPDQFGGKDGRKFMSKRFKREIIATSHLDMEAQKQELDRIIEAWRGERYEQIDDILVIGIKI